MYENPPTLYLLWAHGVLCLVYSLRNGRFLYTLECSSLHPLWLLDEKDMSLDFKYTFNKTDEKWSVGISSANPKHKAKSLQVFGNSDERKWCICKIKKIFTVYHNQLGWCELIVLVLILKHTLINLAIINADLWNPTWYKLNSFVFLILYASTMQTFALNCTP